jgi:dihydrofolate reductase
MGRKTFESIGRALPNRRNIVLSSQDISIDGVEVYSSIEVLCNTLNWEWIDNVCIIGGQKIYEEFLTRGLVDEIWLSRISGDYEGDVFLPHFEDSFIEEETTEFDTFRFTRYMSSKS